jgi:hypothetical protein
MKEFIKILLRENLKNFNGESITKPRIFYRGINPEGGNRVRVGLENWDSMLFCADNIKSASGYGSKIITIEAKPTANIVYEGTSEWRNLIKGIKGGNLGGSAYPTEFLEEVVIRAKKSGVDAIWFKRQSDYGTGIINKEAFNFSEIEEY